MNEPPQQSPAQQLASQRDERRLAVAGIDRFPALIARAGERAVFRLVEFFTANIRNRNTRTAYGRAVSQFLAWCEKRDWSFTSSTR